MRKIAFENEIIIVDKYGIPVNYIDGKIASTEVISVIKSRLKSIIEKGGISPELDACQIEMRNMGPKESLADAQDEIAMLMFVVKETLEKDFGLYISQDIAPCCEFDPMHSGGDRYKMIHQALMSKGLEFRKATNIAGIHLNLDCDLELYRKINNYIGLLFGNLELERLGMSPYRLYQYEKTVIGIRETLGMNVSCDPKIFQSVEEMKRSILEQDGTPKFDYGFTRLKKIGNNYVGEIRTFDGGVDIEDLINKTQKAYELMKEIEQVY